MHNVKVYATNKGCICIVNIKKCVIHRNVVTH